MSKVYLIHFFHSDHPRIEARELVESCSAIQVWKSTLETHDDVYLVDIKVVEEL